MLGWFFSGHPIVDVSNGLSPLLHHPHRVQRPWGFGYPPLGLAHVHFVPVSPSTVACPSLTRGQLEGPPEAPEGLLLPVEAGSLPWQGVDAFPLGLGTAAVPLWLEVAGCPPYLGVGSGWPPLGAG